MTTADRKLIENNQRRRWYPQDNDITEGADKLAAEVRKMSRAEAEKWIVDEKTRKNGCFGAVVGVLAIIGALVAVLS